jgi:hypothetical protein
MTDKEAIAMALDEFNASAEKMHEAIAALKERLADPMRDVQRLGQEPVRLQCVTCGTVYANGVPPQVAWPEQEPVAFASHGVINWIADKQFQHEADLYTTPPQRIWVGLTDEEKGFCAAPTYVETVARIEAKLKEKNT